MATVYAPLNDFHWVGNQFQITDDLLIADTAIPPALAELPGQQGEMDWRTARDTRHWLQFECPDDSPVSPNETSNLVLLALWIANPSRTQIRMRFRVAAGGKAKARIPIVAIEDR